MVGTTRLESRISDREISHEANLSPFSEGGGGSTFRPFVVSFFRRAGQFSH